jgi:hypothetical protein
VLAYSPGLVAGSSDWSKGEEAMNVQCVQTIRGRREGVCQSAAEVASNDDRWLVAQAKAGRASPFGELYERHRLNIHRTAYRILRNQEDADGSAQRSFQHAFTNLSRFREDSAFATWVTSIAINEALAVTVLQMAAAGVLGCFCRGEGQNMFAKLLDDFGRGRMTRRQLIESLAVVDVGAAGTTLRDRELGQECCEG